jgi:hypothetical protein
MQLIYFQGQDVGLTASPLDDNGDPVTGTVAVSVTVTDPSGVVVSPNASPTVGGAYGAVVESVAKSGVWLVRWTATAPGVNWVLEDQFQVRAMGIEQLIDLASVKAHLNMNPSDTRQDDELQGYVLAAAELARNHCGPFLPEQHTQFFDGGSPRIFPDWTPLLTVQSVTEYYGLSAFAITEQQLGNQTDAFSFTVDYQTGELTRRTFGGEAAFWAAGAKNVKVVYTAGRAEDVPYTVRLGALEIIRHLWQMTQQGGRPKFGGTALDGADGPAVLTGFAIPQRVVELWAPYRRAPGIA